MEFMRCNAVHGSALAAGVVCAAALTVLVGHAQTVQPRSAAPTFTEQVAPIVFRNCTSCHRPGESAPFSLMSYAEVRPRARQIAAVTKARQMPPWKAGAGDFAYKGERRLRDEDIDVLQRWVDAGMPEGDPAKLPAMPAFTQGWQLGEPDLVVRMPEPYDVPVSGRDVYRNFVLPLNLTDDVWVKAVDFRPSARAVVHHALFFLDPTGAARELDERDPLPGYAGGMGGGLTLQGGRLLFGGRGANRGNAAGSDSGQNGIAQRVSAVGGTLGGWAPGAQPRMLPDDLAFRVERGSDLIISTHFHPNGQPAQEASTVGLYFAKGAPSKRFTSIQLPPVFGLFAGINIPAGESRYTIADSFVVPVAVRAFGVVGHAHYLAKELKMTATLPGGVTKTLLSIADWDFGWQEQYQFAGYVDLSAGTRLDVSVAYDNSAANRRNPSTPPQPVRWGEQSTDEMGSVSLQVVAANEHDLPELQQAFALHVRETAVNSPVGKMLIGLGRGRGRGRQ
jgi:hypothetical protein